MAQHRRDLLVAVVFAGFIAFVFLWFGYVSLYARAVSRGSGFARFREIMGRAPNSFQRPTPRRFLSGEFQRTLESAAQDNLPFSTQWIPVYGIAYRSLNREILSILPGSWTPFLPIGGKGLEFKDNSRLAGIPAKHSEPEATLLVENASYYNSLVKEFPQVRLTIFPIISAADWLVPRYSLNRSAFVGDRYAVMFGNLLDPRIGYSWAGKGYRPEDALNLFYKTDHHFTMPGAHKVYLQLFALIRTPSLCEPYMPKHWIEIKRINFLGSYARASFAFDDFSDVLQDSDFALPPMNVRVINQSVSHTRRSGVEFLALKPAGKFANYYAEYFGNDYGLICYSCPSAPERNLLVIGDSYDNCLERLLAAHFRRSYYVDIRYYQRDIGAPWSLRSFIKQYGITDTVIIGDQYWIFFNAREME